MNRIQKLIERIQKMPEDEFTEVYKVCEREGKFRIEFLEDLPENIYPKKAEEIKKEILEHFPTVSVSYYFAEEDTFFISIDKFEIYNSNEYLEFIFNISTRLMKEGIGNIMFTYNE